MEGVEDIPGSALAEGVPWGAWESFEEYLDFLDGRAYAVDFAAQLPHSALRMLVMGERAIRNEDATGEDIAQMRDLAERADTAVSALAYGEKRRLEIGLALATSPRLLLLSTSAAACIFCCLQLCSTAAVSAAMISAASSVEEAA